MSAFDPCSMRLAGDGGCAFAKSPNTCVTRDPTCAIDAGFSFAGFAPIVLQIRALRARTKAEEGICRLHLHSALHSRIIRRIASALAYKSSPGRCL